MNKTALKGMLTLQEWAQWLAFCKTKNIDAKQEDIAEQDFYEFDISKATFTLEEPAKVVDCKHNWYSLSGEPPEACPACAIGKIDGPLKDAMPNGEINVRKETDNGEVG